MNGDDLARLWGILDKISERQDDHAVSLATLIANGGDQLRRTEVLEKELEPIKRHINFVTMLGSFAIGCGGFVGVLKSLKII